MMKYLLPIFLFFSFCVSAQNTFPIYNGRHTDTGKIIGNLISTDYVKFPKYATPDSFKFFGIDVNGFLILRDISSATGILLPQLNDSLAYYVAKRDSNKLFITLQQLIDSLNAHIGGVISVNSKTGVVSLTTTDIPEGTNLYFTNARVYNDSVVYLAYVKTLIAAKVGYGDTAAMLIPYMRRSDSITYYATEYDVDTAKRNIRNAIPTTPTLQTVLAAGNQANYQIKIGKVNSAFPYNSVVIKMNSDSSVKIVLSDTGNTRHINLEYIPGPNQMLIQAINDSGYQANLYVSDTKAAMSVGNPVGKSQYTEVGQNYTFWKESTGIIDTDKWAFCGASFTYKKPCQSGTYLVTKDTVGAGSNVSASLITETYFNSHFPASSVAANTIFGNNTNASAPAAFFTPTLTASPFGNEGSAHKQLHGGTSFTWSTTDLANDVGGILSIANGGTNATTQTSLNGTPVTYGANTTVNPIPAGTAGTYGTATTIPQFTTNIYGEVTAVTTLTVTPAIGSVTGLGANVATWLATPSSANLAAALTDETGSGAAVFATSPTLVTPLLGTPTSGTLTNCTGLPLTTGVTGTLAKANGGTGATTTTSINATPITYGGNTTITAAPTGSMNVTGGSGITITGAASQALASIPSYTITASGGGGGSPGGTAGAINYNYNGTAFGGDASNLNWDTVNHAMGLGGTSTSGVNLTIHGQSPIRMWDGGNNLPFQISIFNTHIRLSNAFGYEWGQFAALGGFHLGSDILVVANSHTLCVSDNGTAGTFLLGTETDNGVDALQVLGSGNFTTFCKAQHFVGNSSIPSIAAGAGAGAGPTISMGTNSTDVSGYINVTTGTLPTLSATVATITFAAAYGIAPKIILVPANSNASLLSGATMVFVNQAGVTTTTFAITAGITALGAATAYQWWYQISQ